MRNCEERHLIVEPDLCHASNFSNSGHKMAQLKTVEHCEEKQLACRTSHHATVHLGLVFIIQRGCERFRNRGLDAGPTSFNSLENVGSSGEARK